MLRFKSYEECKGDPGFISPVDAMFGLYLRQIPWELVADIAYRVDQVKVDSTLRFTAKFLDDRRLHVSSLSSGCKAAILASFFRDDSSKIIDLRECGTIALKIALQSLDNADAFAFIAYHIDIDYSVFPGAQVQCKDRVLSLPQFLDELIADSESRLHSGEVE